METTTAPAAPIVLEVHLCAQRRSIKVTFATDAQAAAYIEAHGSTCAFFPWDEADAAWATADLTVAALFPSCEHGLSLSLCAGPGHYPADRPF